MSVTTGSIFDRVVAICGAQSPADANRALANARAAAPRPKRKRRGRKRDPSLPPARGHPYAWGKRPPVAELVWRGPGRSSFPDGRTRAVQVLETMMTQPGLWWGRADLASLLVAPDRMSYGSLSATLAKLLWRGWIEKISVGPVPKSRGTYRNDRKGQAWRMFRPTRDGRALVAMLR